ncbi:HlyD family secretion protein [Massilia sp. CT11-108]|uniref:HlyD family secretion protein n=1 Tax=Massilia sp. CT11-108 TaxID=3393900 RepID=UPI0039A73812
MQREPDPIQDEVPLPLFRPEVWDAKATQWFGPIRLTQPVSGKVMASIALCVTLGLVAFGLFGTYTKKLSVTGLTMPHGGSITISSFAPGIIVRNYVAEGERVTRDQTMFEISSEQYVGGGALASLLSRQIDVRQESVDAERRSRIAQETERRRELDARLENLAAEEAQLQQDLELNRRRQRLSQATVTKFETLQRNGFVSEAQVQQKVEETIDISSRLSALNRSLLQLRANRITISAERDSLANNLSATLAQLDRSEAALRQERAENQTRQRTLIKATADGIVTTITNRPGQFVQAGQVLATLMPSKPGAGPANEELEVHLYVTSRAIGFAQVGQAVRIRYRAFPYERFGLYDGKVIGISKTPLASNELPANIAGTVVSNAFANSPGGTEGLYRIRVKPAEQFINIYGKPQPLTAGMTLEADLMLDTRRIWEWAFAPALGFVARSTQISNEK